MLSRRAPNPLREWGSSHARRLASVFSATLILATSMLGVFATTASARAADGPNAGNVTVNGFSHEPLGSYLTNVGQAYCIEAGAWYPGDVQTPVIDVPAGRGVSAKDRNALAYALWAYGGTQNGTTAGGLAAVAYGLSGDNYASTSVPSMTISNAAVKAEADRIYYEAQSRSSWVTGPWTLNTTLTFQGGMGWFSKIHVTAGDGTPVVGKQISLVPYNVVGSQSPGVTRTGTTDANGDVNSAWTQNDPNQPITVDSTTDAPRYYNVWRAGPETQIVVTGNATGYNGHGANNLPNGNGQVLKATTNPAYQDAIGATFDVQPSGGGASLGTLTVGASGFTNVVNLPTGTYRIVETSAPAGVKVDPTPHSFTITAGGTAVINLVDEVERNAQLNLLKVDEATGAPVAGAVLKVEKDSNNDGVYDLDKGDFTTGLTPVAVPGLSAGKYQITEVTPPPGYLAPAVTQKFVTLNWDQTTGVTFDNHKVPSITTHSQSQNTGTTGNITVSLGTPVRDVAVVNGLAPTEKASITSNLYGPFSSQNAMVCDAAHSVWSGTFGITGSGSFPSPEFTPVKPGIYGYVETLTVPGAGSYSGKCGETSETVTVLTPTITTKAQAPKLTPGAPTTDIGTVTNLAPTVKGVTVETSLYGPFKDADALTNACTPSEGNGNGLGEPVGTVTDSIAGSGEHESSAINLPTEAYAGVYTFIETLKVPGYPPITHECGTPPETFTVPPSPTISTVAQAPKLTPGAAVTDLATVKGLNLDDGDTATIETSLYGPFKDAAALTQACLPSEAGNGLGKPVGTVTDKVAADGEHKSSAINLPTEAYAGVYTFIETLKVPGYPPITHECGTPPETFTVPPSPTISTQAQVPSTKPGSPVTDLATVKGMNLEPGEHATIETSLYGPFKDADALANACKVDSMGNPVGTVTDTITSNGDHVSSAINIPTDDPGGVYTFVETLKVPGYPPITHECGTPPETFTTPHPTKGAGQVTAGQAALPVTGADVLGIGGLGVLVLGLGLGLVAATRRRNGEAGPEIDS